MDTIFLTMTIHEDHWEIRSWMESLSLMWILSLARSVFISVFLFPLIRVLLITQETIRLLLFDCLVHNEQSIMSKPLSSRYGVRYYS